MWPHPPSSSTEASYYRSHWGPNDETWTPDHRTWTSSLSSLRYRKWEPIDTKALTNVIMRLFIHRWMSRVVTETITAHTRVMNNASSQSNETFLGFTDDNSSTSSNGTEADGFASTTDYSNTPMAVILSVSAIFINALVLICIIREKKLRRPANYYIFSLAINEIVEALIPVNSLMVYQIFNGWPLGLVLCKVWITKQ